MHNLTFYRKDLPDFSSFKRNLKEKDHSHYKCSLESEAMRSLYEVRTRNGMLKLVEGRFNVLHEIPLRSSLLRAMGNMEVHWSVAALGRNGRVLGEVDALCFLPKGKTWLNAFEFKTSLNHTEVVRQEVRARFVISLARMWLKSRRVDVLSWSYTVVVRGKADNDHITELRNNKIGVLTWMKIDNLSRYIFRKVVRRDIKEIPHIRVGEWKGGEKIPLYP